MKSTILVLAPLLLLGAVVPASDSAAYCVNAGGTRLFSAAEKLSKGNFCISPYSIQSALAMTYAGAKEATASQMASALGFPQNPARLAASFHQLDADLATSAVQKDVSLSIANRLYGSKGFDFRQEFLDLLKREFGAPLEAMDFKKSPARAAEAINAWVEGQTAKRIRDLVPPNALTSDTTLVLVNALYLKMPWDTEFPAGATAPLPFAVNGDGKVPVPTMSRTGRMGYLQSGGFTAVAVPFRGGQFQFLVFLPDSPQSADLPTAAILAECAEIPTRDVRLLLPKFHLSPPTISLSKALESLGVKAAFDIPQGSANFDGMAPRRPDDYLFLSDVFHKTFFALDEKGVEAAAATAVVMMRATGMPARREPVEVRVDRPFFFAVQHIPSSTCLFLGKLSDPR